MPRISIWWKLAALGLIGYLAAALFFGTSAQAQKDDKDKKDKKDENKNGPTKAYYGIEGCRAGGAGGIGCHNQDVDAKRPPGYVCRANEIKFWLKNDKHSTAYRVLITNKEDAQKYAKLDLARYTDEEQEKLPKEGELVDKILKDNSRAIQMEQILAETDRGKQVAKETGGTYRVAKDPACLACHAQVIPTKLDDRPKTKEDKEDKDKDQKRTVTASFHEEEGVNCVVCHGPYRDWVIEHTGLLTGSDKWRATKREIKEQKYGMTDLWDPAKRTRLCASCHIGHPGDDKDIPTRFVTHEMYAAGHPPLPGFEVATFSNEMPRHWDYIREKNPKVVAAQQLDPKLFEVEQTQLVFIGAATALAEQMRLLASQATMADEKDQVIDLANFDCYACHHGLASDAWRQKRGYGDRRPGRLPMRPWSMELIRLAIHQAESTTEKREARYKEYQGLLNEVNKAYTSRMYGNPKEIAKTATALAKWGDKLANDLIEKSKKSPATEKDARELYQAIPATYFTDKQSEWIDFDSARQVAWGFKVTYYEANRLDWLTGKLKEKDGKEKEPSKEVKEVLAQLNKLATMLKMDLPNKPKSIDDDLELTLKKLNDYKPTEFYGQLEALRKSLK